MNCQFRIVSCRRGIVAPLFPIVLLIGCDGTPHVPLSALSEAVSESATHYSTLDYQHDNNVSVLAVAWKTNARNAGRVTAALRQYEGLVYTCDDAHRIHAFAAQSGDHRWTCCPGDNSETHPPPPAASVHSGISVEHGFIHMIGGNGRLTATDAGTGQHTWTDDTLLFAPLTPVQTGLSVVAVGRVTDESNAAAVTALDAATGIAQWVTPIPVPDTIPESRAIVFHDLQYDPAAGLVFISLSDGGLQDRDDPTQPVREHTWSTVVAIDATTGTIRWDATDLSPETQDPAEWLIPIRPHTDSVTQPMLVQASRIGDVIFRDQRSGREVSRRPVNEDTDAIFDAIRPSFNIRMGLLLIPLIEFTSETEELDEPRSAILAVDPVASEIRWKMALRSGERVQGGLLSTSGNLLYLGDQDGWLNVHMVNRGQLIHRVRLEHPVTSPPLTYRVDGIQYVAVASAPRASDPPSSGSILALRLGAEGFDDSEESVRMTHYPGTVQRTAPQGEAEE